MYFFSLDTLGTIAFDYLSLLDEGAPFPCFMLPL